jgi:uncharacterized cupredoxin-like copper-binding protein
MNAPLKFLAAALCGLLLGLPAAQADDYWPTTDVLIQFGTEGNELTVSPPALTLQFGELYRIVVINPSANKHVVAAPELAAMGLTTSLVKGLAKVDNPAANITAGISVGPGQEIEWTFMPLEKGTYKLGCDSPVHAAAGMHTMLKVVHEVL